MQNISQFRIRPPRFNMVNFKTPPSSLAILTNIIIAIQNITPHFYIFFTIKSLITNSGKSALPIPMILSNKFFRIIWWATSGRLASSPNSRLMRGRQYPSFISARYTYRGFYSGFFGHHASRSAFNSKGRYFFSYIFSFCRIVIKITKYCSTRFSAKLNSSTTIGASALYAI
jgi:hypothetical protein